MDLIITDVTDMSGGYVCVAGWSTDEGRMVRPLHAAGHHHWPENTAHEDMFAPGNIVAIAPSGQQPQRNLPHKTEDTFIAGEPKLVGKLDQREMVEAVSGSVYSSVSALFGHDLTDRKYLVENLGARSLGAVEIPSKRVRFYENDYGYSCWFVNDEIKYSLKITSRAVHQNGIDELTNKIGTVHIRLGFANPWSGPDGENWNPPRCYAMVNGLFIV